MPAAETPRWTAFAYVLRWPGRFVWRVLTGFKKSQGLLLSGAVAYYTLLSVVPMLTSNLL